MQHMDTAHEDIDHTDDIEMQQLIEDDMRFDAEQEEKYQKVLNIIRRNMPAVIEKIEELLQYYEDNDSFDMSDSDWATTLNQLLDMAYNEDEGYDDDYQYE